jgi:galactose-1-phosphate uridylyltransferase
MTESSRQRLPRHLFERKLQAENIETLSYADLVRFFQEEEELAAFLPDGVCQFDPRNGEPVLFNSARAGRPHDNRPKDTTGQERISASRSCVVCEGKTTSSVDVADLSEGFTFINKNLYPVLYPHHELAHHLGVEGLDAKREAVATTAKGLHFLQWTSSLHDKDWHNLPQVDRVIVMKRLAALEKILLMTSGDYMPLTSHYGDLEGRYGFISIIKNGGRLVGGSLAHGHQQIAFSNVIPRRILENRNFELARKETFSAFMLRNNPEEFLIRDYRNAVLLVPYFMRRPFDMLLLLKDTRKRYLSELTVEEIAAVSDGWRDAILFIHHVMPQMGREIAYNVITHNGPGAGLYFEFLPYTQETGGFEHLGLSVCQSNPLAASQKIRKIAQFIQMD